MKTLKLFLFINLFLFSATQTLAADDSLRTITVQGEAEVEIAPDYVEMSFRLNEKNSSAARAKQRVDERINAVIAALENFSISNDDIAMSGVEVTETFEVDRNGNLSSDGFQVTRGVTIRLRNINDYEALSAALVQAGVGELNQIQSGVDDEAQLKMAALEAAARDARTRALAITTGLGVELGMPVEVGENQLRPLLNFQQGNASGRALDQIFMSAERRGAAELPPLFVPGNIKVSATVWVVFELLSE
tara:strand:- start:10420 stop:11163 length:744 start_codon:yes stop_codon:yes gene_type:complete